MSLVKLSVNHHSSQKASLITFDKISFFFGLGTGSPTSSFKGTTASERRLKSFQQGLVLTSRKQFLLQFSAKRKAMKDFCSMSFHSCSSSMRERSSLSLICSLRRASRRGVAYFLMTIMFCPLILIYVFRIAYIYYDGIRSCRNYTSSSHLKQGYYRQLGVNLIWWHSSFKVYLAVDYRGIPKSKRVPQTFFDLDLDLGLQLLSQTSCLNFNFRISVTQRKKDLDIFMLAAHFQPDLFGKIKVLSLLRNLIAQLSVYSPTATSQSSSLLSQSCTN